MKNIDARAEFEAWAQNSFELHRHSAGEYSSNFTQTAWAAWQAGRAALKSPAVHGEVGEGVPDYINDAIDNLAHDNYELSHGGYQERTQDVELIRAYVARARQPIPQPADQQPAPDVQGGPVAWKEPAANWLREKAAKQQATNEQYPEHAKCYPTWRSWVLKLNWLADELSAGAAAPQPAEQQPSPDVAQLVEALGAARDRQEGEQRQRKEGQK